MTDRIRAVGSRVGGDALSKNLTAGAIKVFLLKGCAAGLGVAGTWILSRFSNPTEFGTYATVLSVVTLLGIPAALGFDSYLIPATAQMLVQRRFGQLAGILRRSRDLTLAASVALVAVGIVLPMPALLGVAVAPYLLGLATLPVAAQSRLRQATLTGLHHAFEGQIPENLARPGALVLVAAVMAVALTNLTGFAMVAGSFVAIGIGYATGLVLQHRVMPREVSQAKREFDTVTWTRSATHFVLLTGANQVMGTFPLIAVGLVDGPAEAALFAMASKLAALILFGYAAVNTVLAPAAAKLWATDDIDGLQRTVTYTARLALLSTLPPAIIFVLAGSWILALFGPAYDLAAPALVILAIGQVLNAATGNVMLLLTMTGHQSLGANAQVVITVVSIPLVLLLVGALGATGAALGYVISLVGVNLIWMVMVIRKVGVEPTALGPIRWRSA